MPMFLKPSFKNSSYGIGICDRCKKKMFLDDMVSDGAVSGLRVCVECRDGPDPYLLPHRLIENIFLKNPRPDVRLVVEDGLIRVTEDGLVRITEGGLVRVIEDGDVVEEILRVTEGGLVRITEGGLARVIEDGDVVEEILRVTEGGLVRITEGGNVRGVEQ
jgi:hypothetical protein